MKVLVTGAAGFVGSALVQNLAARGHQVYAASRTATAALPNGAIRVPMDSLEGAALPLPQELDPEVVIHAAAMVHVMGSEDIASLEKFRKVNVEGSLKVARQAKEWGARRLIYVSSVKVLGDSSAPGQPLSARSSPAPNDAYGQSKLEAERALVQLCRPAGIELVVIRPTLIYGPGVKANFAHLVSAVRRQLPLPLGSLRNNLRSLVSLDNLNDLIATCLDHPKAADRSFLVSDDEDVSTAELVERIARVMGVPTRLVSLPEWTLRLAGALTGKRQAVQRLCGTLQVDISETKQVLGWNPPVTLNEGLQKIVLDGERRSP